MAFLFSYTAYKMKPTAHRLALVNNNNGIYLYSKYTMKNFILLATIIVLTTTIKAQTTAIPDANFEQALINLGYDSGLIDGTVPTANISIITSLVVQNKNISDLTGIEDFSSLQYLNCGANSLTNLNVTQNNALNVLHCVANQLTNLDVTQNNSLTKLRCSGNQLSTLNISQNTSLTEIFCSSNQLTNLDITQNLDLSFLRCSSNSLSNLDLTQNVAIDTLNCDLNILTNLDVSQNINLVNLSCFQNQIVSLDISQNTNLISLNCGVNQLTNLDVTKNVSLTALFCGINQLTNIDITQNPLLVYFTCSSNQLLSLNLINNTVLDVVKCDSNQINILNVSHNILLTQLHCEKNQLTRLNISSNSQLSIFNCFSNQLICLDIKNGNNHNIFPNGFNATDNPGLTCINADDQAWSTINLPNIDLQSSFSTSCSNLCLVSVEEQNLERFSIYPNPTSGSINIDLGENLTNPSIILTNSFGQVVLTKSFSTTDFISLDINSPKGIYFLQLQTESGEVITKKIVKE